MSAPKNVKLQSKNDTNPNVSISVAQTILLPEANSQSKIIENNTYVQLPDSQSGPSTLSDPNSYERDKDTALLEAISISLNKSSVLKQNIDHHDRQAQRYIPQNKLGEGNFGIVWRAMDNDIGRFVAIKSFKGMSIKHQAIFENEIKFAGRLDHPGIPPLYDIGIDENGKYYFVMKYIQGNPLNQIIAQLKAGDLEAHQRFTFERRADLIIQLLRILKQAHASNILHRDIKPENIIIGASDEVMLVDWGIALDLKEGNGENFLCGTLLYMSPEQATMKALSRQSDIYSVGAVFYELLSLEKPIPSMNSIDKMIEQVTKYEPKRLDWIFHSVQGYPPSEYRSVIEKALKKNPNQRFFNADQMLKALINSNVGCVDVICPRTMMKKGMYELMKWVNFNPFKNIPILIILLLASILLCFYMGFITAKKFYH